MCHDEGASNAIGSRKGWPAKSRKRPAVPRAVMVSSDDPGSSDRVNQPSWLRLQKVTGGPDLDRAFEDVDKGIVGRCKLSAGTHLRFSTRTSNIVTGRSLSLGEIISP